MLVGRLKQRGVRRASSTGSLVTGLAITQTVSWGVLYYTFAVLLVPMQEQLGWSRGLLVGGFTVAIVVSGVAAPTVGRQLDADRARPLMVGGSLLGAASLLGLSSARAPVAYYVAWVGIGLAMAAVFYEPAFTVLVRRTAPHHRRAITIVTLCAGLASFLFQPLTGVLVGEVGWRGALRILAVAVGAITIPIHLAILSPDGESTGVRRRPQSGVVPEAREVRFWLLTAAFVGVTTASLATGVLLIAFLVDQGWTLGRAAFAGGILGVMQLPGRLAFGPLAARLPRPLLVGVLFAMPALGILLLHVADGGAWVWVAVTILGIGQGTTTLLRATLYVDLYGIERIGVLNGISGAPITVARALAPLGASVLIGRTGSYTAAYGVLIGYSVVAAVIAPVVLAERGSGRVAAS